MESLRAIETALRSLEGPLATGLRIFAILLLAWVFSALLSRAIHSLRLRVASHMQDRESVKRAETIARVCSYVVAVVISLITLMLVLSQLGVTVAPLLGAAGVAGVAVGFGAQSLVKDYFNGLFILIENQIRQGDAVKLGEHAGLVEEVTLRYVKLRDYDGNVYFIPNGTISTVINMSRGFSYSVVNVGIAHGGDIDHALAVMARTGEEMAKDAAWKEKILGPFEVAGVEKWDETSVTLRGRFCVSPLEQWPVRREYLRRLKYAFDAEGIAIPAPQRVIYLPQPDTAS